MKKNTTLASKGVVVTAGSAWALSLLGLVSPNAFGADTLIAAILPFLLLLSVVTSPIAIAVLIKGVSRKAKDERYVTSPLAKSLSLLIVGCLYVSTYAATRSLWYSPFMETWGEKYTYQNLATALSLAALMFVVLLSTMQSDMFWISQKGVKLDERQAQLRRVIYERSYKAALAIAIFFTLVVSVVAKDVSAVLANNFGHLPTHIYWLPFNMIVLIVAAPLILASWHDRRK